MRVLKRFLIGLLATVGGLALVVTVAAVVSMLWIWPLFEPEEEGLPEKFILSFALPNSLDEVGDPTLIDGLVRDTARLSLFDIVTTLERASADPRIGGVRIDLSAASPGLAEAQELREAIFRLRSGGKNVQVFAESFEGRRSTLSYYLASASDQIWLQPSGLLDMRGLAVDIPFVKRLLDDLGVQADFEARHEFKGVMSSLTSLGLPAPQRENLNRLVGSMFTQIVEGISVERDLAVTVTRRLVDQAPLLADEAKRNGLVDSLGYRDEFRATRGELPGVGLRRYRVATAGEGLGEDRIAVIAAEGPISRGGGSQLRDRSVVSSARLSRALRDARRDPSVKAIVLRVDSPGGSYVAADTIARELEITRRGGVPIVTSMADSAASGGYMLALATDHLVAQPGSITGSIGVAGGKIALGELLERHGIEFERIVAGRNAGMNSPVERYREHERERLAAILDKIYQDFTDRTARARRLSASEVDAAARGRVWTGHDAQRLGLVDALGGYGEAVALAREAASIPPEVDVELVVYPRPRPVLDQLMEMASSRDWWNLARGLTVALDAISRIDALSDEIGVRRDDNSVWVRAPKFELR